MISVIIPTYEPSDYLFTCIDSIKKQTLEKEKFEVLIILNGTKEPYYSRLKKYLDNDNQGNLYLYYLKQSGVSNARNFGIEIAKGSHLTFIDDDDIISPEYLKEFYKYAGKDNLVISKKQIFKNEKSISFKNDNFEVFTKSKLVVNSRTLYIYKKSFYVPWMKLIPKEIIGLNRFSLRFKNGEDSLFMFQISNGVKEICETNSTATYFHRIRENSASQKNLKFSYILKNRLLLICEYTRIFFKGIGNYNLILYINFILASLKAIIVRKL